MVNTLNQLQEVIDAADKLLPDHTTILVQEGRLNVGQQFEVVQVTPTARKDGTGVCLTIFVREIAGTSDDDDE